MEQALLQCTNLVKCYGKKQALNGVDLSVMPGRITGLLGPNGSGKTTWMKMAAGLIKPTFGEIRYNGHPISIETRKEIAYMSTEPFFYDYMTVGDVGKYYQDFFDDFSMEKYDDLLEKMSLEKKLKVKSLSSGMLAKLKVAVTMARNAKIYMLDEPLNGIDLLARDSVMNMILTSAGEDNTLIISSHLVEELESVVDKAIFIKEAHFAGMVDVEELRTVEGISLADKYRQVIGGIEMGGMQ